MHQVMIGDRDSGKLIEEGFADIDTIYWKEIHAVLPLTLSIYLFYRSWH